MTNNDSSLQAPYSALVAGATGGLGSAIARQLVSRGATLTLVSRDQQRLDSLDIPGYKHALDLRTATAASEAVELARTNAGRLDAVVNAVGVVAFGTVDELTVDVIEELFLTNTFVSMFLARAALDALEPGGVLVNLSGVIAEQNLPGMSAYGASKAAVRSFDEALAREARRRKIRVIDARPPHTETGLADRPIAGTAPKMPTGLQPDAVAGVIVDAMMGDVDDLPSSSFK